MHKFTFYCSTEEIEVQVQLNMSQNSTLADTDLTTSECKNKVVTATNETKITEKHKQQNKTNHNTVLELYWIISFD